MQVFGPSMVPTLRSGDVVLVRHGGRPVRAGDVVVGMFRRLPGHLVVKRAAARDDGGWTLVSDNVAAGSDSSVYGRADVFGRAVLRLRPGPGPLWRPARVGRAPFGPDDGADWP